MHFRTANDGTIPKARLVSGGFEEIDNDHVQIDSPTCDKDSSRVILVIMAQKRRRSQSMDIKSAFFQRQKLKRYIFIHPPKEAGCPGKIWHLKMCMWAR